MNKTKIVLQLIQKPSRAIQLFLVIFLFNSNKKGFVFFTTLFFLFIGINISAQVTVTPASTGGSISADIAANATTPGFASIGNIVITETANGNFATNATQLVLNAPTGWEFKTSGVTTTVTGDSGQNVTVGTITYTSTTITLPLTVGNINKTDILTIIGIQLRATDGAAIPNAGIITPTVAGTISGLTNGSTNLGSLSQVVGAHTRLVATLPGQTFTDGATLAGSGNSGTVSAQTVGTPFNIIKLTATDQFYNLITTYAGSKTIIYSGPGSSSGGSASYTTVVTFSAGVSTTTLTTSLRKAETVAITAKEGSSYGFSSSNVVINPKSLTITSPAVTSKIYDGTTTATITGFLSGNLSGDVVTLVGTGAFSDKNVGTGKSVTSTSTTGGADAANYTITQPTGLTGNITARALSITASSASKFYGQTFAVGAGSTAFSSSGLQNSETIGSITIASTGAVNTALVNTYALVPTAANGGTFTTTNYSITYVDGILSVNPASLTITANNGSKSFGQTFTVGAGSTAFSTSGLQNSETIGSITIASTGAVNTAGVGTYSIVPSAATGGLFTASNYSIIYTNGTLTVNPTIVTVTASAQSKTYGTTAPTSGTLNTNYTVSGLQNSDVASGTTLGYNGSPAGNLATANAGSYSITPSVLTLSTGLVSNYSITYSSGTLTVNPANITVTASNQSKTYGSTAPTSGTNFTVSGLLNSDVASGTTLGYNGTPTGNLATASAGNYSITPSVLTLSTGSVSNYNITYTSGILTVNAADPTSASASSPSICAGANTTLNLNGGGGETAALVKWYATSCGGTAIGTGNGLSVSPIATTTYFGRYEGIYTTACASVTVTVSPLPAVGTVSADQTICSGNSLLSDITISSATGTIQWQMANDSGFSSGLSNIGTNSTTLTIALVGALTSTKYFRAIVTSGVCTSITSSTVTVTVTPTVGTPTAISISAGTEPSCQLTNGTTTTTYNTTSTNNTGLNWTLSNAAAGSINSSGIMTWTNGFFGTVNIQVTANGCNGPSSQVVRTVTISPTVGTPTAITISSGSQPSCQLSNGTTTTTYATTATNNTGFNWSLSNAAAGSINSSGVMTWVNGFSGSVDIRVTASGCNGPSIQVDRAVSITPNNTVSAPSSTPTLCGISALTAITHTTTGATGITNSGVSGANGLPAGVSAGFSSNTITITGTPSASGTFNYSIPLTGGCGSITANGTITVLSNTTITATSNSVVCMGNTLNLFGAITSGAVGTPTYSWVGPLGFSSTLQNPSIANVPTGAAGDYTLTVTNGNGCTTSQTTAVIINPVPNVNIDPTFTSGFVKKATGQSVLYSYTITNIGNVSDIFDLSAVWVNDNSNSVDMDIRYKVGALFYSTPIASPTIPPGGTFTFQVELQVQGNAPRVLNHTKVTATSRLCTISSTSADMYTYEYNGSLPTASSAQLELSKTASTTSAIVGIAYNYVITIVNNSSSTAATGVIISDQVPANLTITNNGGGNQSGQTITWDIGTLTKIGAGVNTVQKTITVVPTCATVPSVTNTANVLSTPPDNGLGVKVSSVTTAVVDNVAPTAICKPLTVFLDASGNVTITTAMINNGSSDNCSIQSITIDKSSFNCSNLGANTVTLTVKDPSGNTSTCTSTVTVVDNQSPVFTSCPTTPAPLCADNLTTYIKVGTSWNATATDNCSVTSLTYTLTGSTTGTGTNLNGVVFNVGTTTITWSAVDAGGNITKCIFSVTINPLPVITTQPINQLDCEGASVKFKVIASGSGLTYTWQRKRPADTSFVTVLSGGNITFPSPEEIKIDNVGSSQSPSGTQYQVIVSNSSGCNITSSAATLLVNEITGITSPILSPVQPVTDVKLCFGANYSYTVTTSTPPPGLVVSYHWKTNASGSWNNVVDGVGTNFLGAQTATLNIINGTPAESAEYKVQVIFTSSGADCTVTTALTRKITFLPQLTTPVTTVTQPTCTTATGTITVTVQSTSDTYSFDNGLSYQISNVKSSLVIGNYNVIIKNSSGCTSPTLNVAIKSSTNTWNGSVWSNGTTPISTENIVFNANYISTGDLTACSCTVNTGVSVTMNSGHTLTLTNGLTVNGSLTFEDSASLVQINNVSNSGSITYKRNFTGGELDYTYWSSPVASQNLYTLSPLTKLDKFYSFNSSINNWVGENPSTTTMTIGKGYIIRGVPPTSLIPSGFNTNSFVGVPNNGNYSIGVVGVQISNLIGNPYPSALDADQFLFDNQSVIDGKITFWTHNTAIQLASNITNGTAGSGAYAYTSDDYASYNLTGGVGTGVGTIANSGGNAPTGKIAAGQSFFTKSKLASGTVIFSNSMRLNGSGIPYNNSNFYKTKNPKTNAIEKNRVWLNLTNTQGAFKQTLVGYITGATNDIDNLYDGKTSDGNKFVDFYTINQGQNLTIQGRALPFDENDEVPIGYRTTINGSFTINIDQTDGFLSNQPIYLEDKLTNSVFNLKSGNYTFNTTSGTFNNRFVLRYNSKTLSIDETDKEDGILVFYSRNYKMMIIQNNDIFSTVKSVTIFSLTGQKIGSWNFTDSEQTNNIQIPIKNISSGIYIVKVNSAKGEITKKIIVN